MTRSRPGAKARLWRRRVVAVLVVCAVGLGGAVLLAGSQPVRAVGDAEVSGTAAAARFQIGGMTVRQVRYADRRQLAYSFSVANTGAVPLWLTAAPPGSAAPTLLRLDSVEFDPPRLDPYGRSRVTLRVLMTNCEYLSARAGSVLAAVRLTVRVLGLVPRTVSVTLPEQLRIGSPREVSCPRATSRSRPPG
ncbi:MAG: hypothetical protein ACRDTM_02840 [Micromonosporaceae bacterium]